MSENSAPVRILILGTGTMAAAHADAFQKLDGVEVVAGVDRRADVLAAFCDKFDIEYRFDSLEAAIKWGGFDAATNVTPDAAHHATTMQLLAAGKHVLCEKPLATNAEDATEMAETAKAKGLIGMVNLSYRNVSALQKAASLVAEGAIGTIRHFEASYLQSWLTQPAWGDWKTESQWLWRLSTAHGSKGVLGDVGIHILDYLTFAVGSPVNSVACRLKTFDKAPGGQIGEYKLDANDSFTLQAELANGAIGTVSATRFASGHLNDLRLRLYGDAGGLEVLFENAEPVLRMCGGADLEAATWQDVPLDAVPTIYERFADAVRTGKPGDPDFAHGARLQAVLDQAERSDQEGGRFLTVAG